MTRHRMCRKSENIELFSEKVKFFYDDVQAVHHPDPIRVKKVGLILVLFPDIDRGRAI